MDKLLLAWLLAAMSHLAPNRDHQRLADAVYMVVSREQPLFKNDPLKLRTASLMTAVLFREGSLRVDIKGDKDKAGHYTSFCPAQINLPYGAKTLEGWTGEDLVEDPEKCVAVEYRMLKQSVRMCPKHPVAYYAEGNDPVKTCASTRAQRISNDRMFLAGRLVKEVKFPEPEHASFAQPDVREVPAGMYPRRMLWPGLY